MEEEDANGNNSNSNENGCIKTQMRTPLPVHYLLGGGAVMLLLIAVAFILLLFSWWKSHFHDVRRRPSSSEEALAHCGGSRLQAEAAFYQGDDKVAVIMAGDDSPTFIATKTRPPSQNAENIVAVSPLEEGDAKSPPV